MAEVRGKLSIDQIIEITRSMYKPLEGQVFSGNVMDASHLMITHGPKFQIAVTEEPVKTTMETIRTIMEELFEEKVWKGITPGSLWVLSAPLGYQKLKVVRIDVVPLEYPRKTCCYSEHTCTGVTRI